MNYKSHRNKIIIKNRKFFCENTKQMSIFNTNYTKKNKKNFKIIKVDKKISDHSILIANINRAIKKINKKKKEELKKYTINKRITNEYTNNFSYYIFEEKENLNLIQNINLKKLENKIERNLINIKKNTKIVKDNMKKKTKSDI